MKRALSMLVLLAVLLICLSSCDIVKPVSEIDPNKPSPPSGNTDKVEPVVDPADEKWSWGYSGTSLGENWYLDGKTDSEFFTVQPDEDGLLRISFFDAGSTASPGNSSSDAGFLVSDRHVTNEPGAEKEFDLIFTDPFTAFDAVSGEYYVRGDYVSLFDDLTATAFRSTIYPQEYIVLHTDGTAEDIYEGLSYPGSWYVENAHRFLYHDDETDTDLRFYYSYSEDGTFNGVTNSAGELWEPFTP
ncbi:MAG: hypothetical protein J5933_03810 [Clostridia bacterium]|nr:hypothetical protein [Clostridia bacterium]